MADKLKLAQWEINDKTWQRLAAHYEAKLAGLRKKLENPHTAEDQRTGLIWQVHTIKEFLAHGQIDDKNAADAGE